MSNYGVHRAYRVLDVPSHGLANGGQESGHVEAPGYSRAQMFNSSLARALKLLPKLRRRAQRIAREARAARKDRHET